MLVTINKLGLLVEDAHHELGDPFHIGALWQMMREQPAPDRQLRSARSWRTEVPSRLVQGEKSTVVSTLVGTEKLQGVQTLEIHIHMKIQPDAAAEEKDDVIVDGSYNVDPLAGRLLHAEYRLSNVSVSGPDGAGMMSINVRQDYEPIARTSTASSSN